MRSLKAAAAFVALLLGIATAASIKPIEAEANTIPSAPVFPLIATHQQPTNGPWWSHTPGTDLGGNFDHSSPVITQLTQGGPTVAVVGARDGCIYVYQHNPAGGDVYSRLQYLATFNGGVGPVCIGAEINSSPAIADLDGDGSKEIIFGAGKLYQPGEYGEDQKWNGGIWALRANGSNYWGGHVQVPEGVFATPAIGDIDADGAPDIVWGDFAMNVRAINRDGSNKWSVYIADTVWSSPALTTLPNTNKLATVIGTDLGGGNPGGHLGCPQYFNQPGDGNYLVRGFMLALNEVGGVIAGFPKCLDTPIWSTPALTDLNNDGRLDAVFATNNYFENGNVVGRSARVYAIDLWWPGQAMAYLAGWPVSHTGNEAKSWVSPAIADMNADGVKEVAISNNYSCNGGRWNCGAMFLYSANGGPPIWARVGEYQDRSFMTSPVMADVNNDGRPEAIQGGGDWRIHAMDYAGNYAAEFYTGCTGQQPSQCNAGRQFRNAVAVGDMTGDGKIDIFAAGGTHDNPAKGQVWLLTMPNPSTVAPWPFFKRDELRQSNDFDSPGLSSVPPVTNMYATAGDTKVRGGWTNPSNPSVTGIKLLRKTGSCPANENDGAVVQDSLANTFTVAGLPNGTTQYFGAYAHDGSGNFSKIACASATPLPAPAPPSNLVIRNEDQQVNLFWDNPAGNNFTGVRILRKPGAVAPANPTDGTAIYDGPGTTYTDVGLTNASQYSYAVFAHNGYPDYSAGTTGNGTPAIHSGPSYSMYLAEGYTGSGGFGSIDYFTLGNTSGNPSTVTVTYMFDSGAPVEKNYTLNPNERKTINVNGDVGAGKSVGARISTRSGPGVMVERPMYFSGNPGSGPVDGGHAAIAIPKPLNNWYFAEGYTASGFVEYLTMLNPSGEGPSTVRASYVFNSGPKIEKDYVIQPYRRSTLNVGGEIGAPGREVSVSLAVISGPPVAAERAVYFGADPGLGAFASGGHVHAGAPAPASSWYFAEGYTGPGFVEYLTIQNPNPTATDITATYVFNGGEAPLVRTYSVGANTRRTIRVNNEVGSNKEVSVKMEVWPSKPPVVVERPMYFSANPALGAHTDGGHDVVGAVAPNSAFYFAEGYTGSGFVEYLTIQNPSLTESATVNFDYVFNGGGGMSRTIVVPAASRRTVRVNDVVGPSKEVSVKVSVGSGANVIVERPMYFAANPGLGAFVTGGHDVVGYQPPP